LLVGKEEVLNNLYEQIANLNEAIQAKETMAKSMAIQNKQIFLLNTPLPSATWKQSWQ
jgi:hypothetical protein